jgi:hypothetical protein
MRTLLLFVSLTLASTASPEEGYFNLGEAFSLREGQRYLEVSYRQHTAPSLTEFGEMGVVIDRMEVSPRQIRIAVGESYDMRELKVVTYGPGGGVEEHVPLALDFEGPTELIDYDAWRTYSDGLIGTAAGTATIWVAILAPSSSGEYLKQPIALVVY